MKVFRMADVEKIEQMLAEGKTVVVEWHTPYENDNKIETVKYVRWDGLVFTNGDCVFTGIDKLVDIREVAKNFFYPNNSQMSVLCETQHADERSVFV